MKQAAILWVEDYEDVLQTSLPYSKESAEGFACVLGVPEDQTFLRKNDEVRQDLFTPPGGGQAARADIAPILYYSGHGTDYGPQFNDGQVAEAAEVLLGQNVVAAVFDSCRILSGFESWKSAFGGLRYLLGFTTDVDQSPLRGPYFASRLLEGRSFPEAWRKAATDTKASTWRYLRAFAGSKEPAEEVWPPGPAGMMGSAPICFISRSEDPSPPIPVFLEFKSFASVRLFSTERADEPPMAESLASLFGMGEVQPVPQDRFLQLNAKDSTLELYEESASLWWERRPRYGTELFKAPSPPVDAGSSGGFSDLASVLQRFGLDQYRFGKPWQTFTREGHMTLDGKRRLPPLQVVRHLELPLSLDGLPVLGPGARFRVSFDSARRSEVLLFARKPSLGKEVCIISREDAKARLLNDESFKRVRGAVDIQRWCLGYYALPPRERQDFLIPVYAFEGIVSTDRLRDYHFVRYVPAIQEKELDDLPLPQDCILRKIPPVFP